MGLSVKTSQPFNISGTPDAEIGANTPFNRVAFDLQPGGVSAPVPLSENAAVLQVKSRSPFDEAAFQKGKAELKAKLLQSEPGDLFPGLRPQNLRGSGKGGEDSHQYESFGRSRAAVLLLKDRIQEVGEIQKRIRILESGHPGSGIQCRRLFIQRDCIAVQSLDNPDYVLQLFGIQLFDIGSGPSRYSSEFNTSS